ncbi:MAG: 3-octaprenyl-4-hydroxybenzoate carboxy-lyase [Verrucomicrobia bacterium]|nr:3-octaprenyl-4-hydroxybenzoate carboxy-lyase [Verrucomicrobiota bacterium]
MKLVIGASGASGAIYLQRLLGQIDCEENEVHLVLSGYAKQVIAEEIGTLTVPTGVKQHGDKTMNVPFVSGSARFDAMVICPCSMGTIGRIAAGTSDSTILRAAEAGAIILPASPGFYSRPATIEEVADTVVARILDQLDLPAPGTFRWAESAE